MHSIYCYNRNMEGYLMTNKPNLETIYNHLGLLAPGTPLREGLENILTAKIGALIVVGDSEEVMNVVDGGFLINRDYSPSHLYELAKMDGAIILSKDLKKILYANSLLIPEPSIPTSETGTRHKSAERTSKQTDELIICISQRRNVISLYKGNEKYVLRDTPSIIDRANQALKTLEKYNTVMDNSMNDLNLLELDDLVTLDIVLNVIKRVEMVMRIVFEINRYISELGNEGRLISMQLEELLSGRENTELLVIKDYMQPVSKKMSAEIIMSSIRNLTYSNLNDVFGIANELGFTQGTNPQEISLSPHGYRIMNKIPKLPAAVVNNVVGSFKNLHDIMNSTINQLDDIEGIGELRALAIKEGLKRVKDQLFLDTRYI